LLPLKLFRSDDLRKLEKTSDITGDKLNRFNQFNGTYHGTEGAIMAIYPGPRFGSGPPCGSLRAYYPAY
jgi:hypothetical protein